MILTCPNCTTKYRIPDEKLSPNGTKVRCSRCRHVFTGYPPEPPLDLGMFDPVHEPHPETASEPAAPSQAVTGAIAEPAHGGSGLGSMAAGAMAAAAAWGASVASPGTDQPVEAAIPDISMSQSLGLEDPSLSVPAAAPTMPEDSAAPTSSMLDEDLFGGLAAGQDPFPAASDASMDFDSYFKPESTSSDAAAADSFGSPTSEQVPDDVFGALGGEPATNDLFGSADSFQAPEDAFSTQPLTASFEEKQDIFGALEADADKADSDLFQSPEVGSQLHDFTDDLASFAKDDQQGSHFEDVLAGLKEDPLDTLDAPETMDYGSISAGAAQAEFTEGIEAQTAATDDVWGGMIGQESQPQAGQEDQFFEEPIPSLQDDAPPVPVAEPDLADDVFGEDLAPPVVDSAAVEAEPEHDMTAAAATAAVAAAAAAAALGGAGDSQPEAAELGPAVDPLVEELEKAQDPAPSLLARLATAVLAVVVFLALATGGLVMLRMWKPEVQLPAVIAKPIDQLVQRVAPAKEQPQAPAAGDEQVRNIVLENVRQYVVPNDKAGMVFVVEGKAVNRFTTPKQRIKVEVALYDAQGAIIAHQETLCGNTVSLFQLQIMSQVELEAALSAEVGVQSNNTNLQPGENVPFMVVFFNIPETVKEFGVKVIETKDMK